MGKIKSEKPIGKNAEIIKEIEKTIGKITREHNIKTFVFAYNVESEDQNIDGQFITILPSNMKLIDTFAVFVLVGRLWQWAREKCKANLDTFEGAWH